jgi:hypothetical protein
MRTEMSGSSRYASLPSWVSAGISCRWFTVCAPAGWDPAREEWEVCPCGWRPELGKHYAKAGHVQWWCEQIKKRGSLEAVYREVRRRQREYGDTDVG